MQCRPSASCGYRGTGERGRGGKVVEETKREMKVSSYSVCVVCPHSQTPTGFHISIMQVSLYGVCLSDRYVSVIIVGY